MNIGIGIATFNGSERISRFIKSILETEAIGMVEDWVVIDDCSNRDNESQKIENICKDYGLRYVRNNENFGTCFSWERATRLLNTDIIIICNDDIEVSNGWIKALKFFLENNDGVGMVGFQTDGLLKLKEGLGIPIDLERVLNSPGNCFGFLKILHEKIGGFDQRYKFFYEEIDFGTTLAYHGYDSWTIPFPIIKHYGGETFRSNLESDPQSNNGGHQNISRELYIKKWGHDQYYNTKRFLYSIPIRVMRFQIDGVGREKAGLYEGVDWIDRVKYCPSCKKNIIRSNAQRIKDGGFSNPYNEKKVMWLFICECGHQWQLESC